MLVSQVFGEELMIRPRQLKTIHENDER